VDTDEEKPINFKYKIQFFHRFFLGIIQIIRVSSLKKTTTNLTHSMKIINGNHCDSTTTSYKYKEKYIISYYFLVYNKTQLYIVISLIFISYTRVKNHNHNLNKAT